MQVACLVTSAATFVVLLVAGLFIFVLIQDLKAAQQGVSVALQTARQMGLEVEGMWKAVMARPTTVNQIHLNLKQADLKACTGAMRELSFTAETFCAPAEKWRAELRKQVEEKRSWTSVDTKAYCILAHAGLESVLTGDSLKALRKALVLLLVNGDDEKTFAFLDAVAEGINSPAVDEIAEKAAPATPASAGARICAFESSN